MSQRLLTVFGVVACLVGCGTQDLAHSRGLDGGQHASQSAVDFMSVWNKIEPVAAALCREANRDQAETFCNFELKIASNLVGRLNAQMIIGGNGNPQVHLGRGFIPTSVTADEIAFVMAHEVAHRIANHVVGQVSFRPITSSIAAGRFSLQPVDPHRIELEADAIGTIVSMRGGFDPVAGANILRRLMGTDRPASSSHPDVSRRMSLIGATAMRVAQGHSITW